MSFFSFLSSESVHSIQQLIYQPATRRTATFAGTGAGFTIVELLIVIVIIAVLAAIVVVGYNGLTKNARDVSIRTDISNFEKKIKIWRAENGSYPSPAELTSTLGIRVNKSQYEEGAGNNNNWYYCSNTARTRFAVGATAETSRAGFVYDSETGFREQSGLWGGTTCPSTNVGDPYYNSGAWAGYSCSGTCTWQPYING
jgi:prepilin-type N-terminal cleavage/methylation domain-containing protein